MKKRKRKNTLPDAITFETVSVDFLNRTITFDGRKVQIREGFSILTFPIVDKRIWLKPDWIEL